MVTLTPTASAGAAFRQWTGACTGSGACLVTMDQVRAVGAEFSYPLTVSVAGGGTVASTNIAGIACSPTCSAPFLFNQSVTLAATPATGASFAGWSGACTNTTGTCTVTLAAARAVTCCPGCMPLLGAGTSA